jgi:hypothetical protein
MVSTVWMGSVKGSVSTPAPPADPIINQSFILEWISSPTLDLPQTVSAQASICSYEQQGADGIATASISAYTTRAPDGGTAEILVDGPFMNATENVIRVIFLLDLFADAATNSTSAYVNGTLIGTVFIQ